MNYINIILSPIEGTPNYEFVEIENDAGESISIGEWSNVGKFVKIRIPLTADKQQEEE